MAAPRNTRNKGRNLDVPRSRDGEDVGRTRTRTIEATSEQTPREEVSRERTRKRSVEPTRDRTATEEVSRERLIELLNQDLEREYQAVIAYVVYSQVLKGAQYMSIAKELELHATEELAHAITISRQIDYLGGMPSVTPKPVKTSERAEDMLQFDLQAENTTVREYRSRMRQCEALGLSAIAEAIREILIQEQEHQIDLATALGKDVVDAAAEEELV